MRAGSGAVRSWVPPRLFLQRVRKLLRNKKMSCRARQKSERKSKRVATRRRNDASRDRQSRWLSKERSYRRGKRDRCQNKGDSKSGPNWDAKERLKGWPLADFARGK